MHILLFATDIISATFDIGRLKKYLRRRSKINKSTAGPFFVSKSEDAFYNAKLTMMYVM